MVELKQGSFGSQHDDGSSHSDVHPIHDIENAHHDGRKYSSVIESHRHNHHNDVKNSSKEALKKIYISTIFAVIFMVLELAAGFYADSLALMADAAHLMSDVGAFLLSAYAIHYGSKKGNHKNTFGGSRLETMAAMVSILLIWLLTVILVKEAIKRFFYPREDINSKIMMVVGLAGLCSNLIMTALLGGHSHGYGSECGGHDHDHSHAHGHSKHHIHGHDTSDHQHSHNHHEGHSQGGESSRGQINDSDRYNGRKSMDISPKEHVHLGDVLSGWFTGNTHDDIEMDGYQLETSEDCQKVNENLNVRAAYLHTLGDCVQNVGVIFAGIVLYFRPHWSWVDPLCTMLFAVVVILTTITLMQKIIAVLMAVAPETVDLAEVEIDMLAIPNVHSVHDMHAWSISVAQHHFSCHIVMEEEGDAREILRATTSILQLKYKILHTTVQIDYTPNKTSCHTKDHARCHG